MEKLKLYMDTHDHARGTFPQNLGRKEFQGFFAKYLAACREEGVVILRAHVGLAEGRAFCFSLAPSREAVKRAHDKVGLPFDSITEVETATPGDLFFVPDAA